jgi:hypothetical protein
LAGEDDPALFRRLGGCLAHWEEVEQVPLIGPGVLIEQAEHDLSELGSGIANEVFEGEGTGNDLAAGASPSISLAP